MGRTTATALVVAIAAIATMWAAPSTCDTTQTWVDCAIELAGQACAHSAFPFVSLFIFRYTRLIVHLFSFWVLYKPAPVPEDPEYLPADCTIILPTVEPSNPDFTGCLESCLSNAPGAIIIVTVGSMVSDCRRIVAPYRAAWPQTDIKIFRSPIANKRTQVATAIPHVRTRLIVLLDDHVFWPSLNFLKTAIAPFEDSKVGAVGTNKRVRRTDHGYNFRAFFNMLGAIYLERHNFEIRATNAIDGGVFVISGRTSLVRTHIVQDPAFLAEFTNEMFFFRKLGPLNADDDNCITRWLVTKGWHIKIQYCRDAMIETTLGTYPKFMSQCLRWVRTTWRSNSASLFTDRTVWSRQPWCVYAVYITSFFNFALFNDIAMVYTLSLTSYNTRFHISMLLLWIFCTKMVKLTPYFLRHPGDLIMLPGYFLFAYYHSLIKLWAGLTFYTTAWGGRDLAAIDVTAAEKGDNEDLVENEITDSSDSNGSSIFFDAHAARIDLTMSSAYPVRQTTTRTAIPQTRQPRPDTFDTPWGPIKSRNPHTRPANVLESRFHRAYSTMQQKALPRAVSESAVAAMEQPGTPSYAYSLASPSSTVTATTPTTVISSPIEIDPYRPLSSPLDYQYIMRGPAPSSSSHHGSRIAKAHTEYPVPPSAASSSHSHSNPSTSNPQPRTLSLFSPLTSLSATGPHSHSPSPPLSHYSSHPAAPSSTQTHSTAISPTNNAHNLTARHPSLTHLYSQPRRPSGRKWTRGPDCDKLHYDGCKGGKKGRGCSAVDVWDLPRYVVGGKSWL